MQYTFAQACKQLAASSHAYGATDIRQSINRAIQALAAMSGWECLRKVVTLYSHGPRFTLPQGCAGLVRACVNGKPADLRGRDFRFIKSGPGALRRPPNGFLDVQNILDLGTQPVSVVPDKCPFKLFAFHDAAGEQPPITVRGIDDTGAIVRIQVPLNDPDVDPGAAERTDTSFQKIVEVTLDDSANQYVTLFADDGSRSFPIALYHPEVKAPEFRLYEIPNVPHGRPIEVLAEVRIDPLPLVKDTDILPFSCLEPIEWVIRADWMMKAGEIDAAQKYQGLAANWLRSQEIVEDTKQAAITINSLYLGSQGEAISDAWNI